MSQAGSEAFEHTVLVECWLQDALDRRFLWSGLQKTKFVLFDAF